MTLIHILSKSGASYSCGFYFPVPDAIYDPSSADATRIPASKRLTVSEVNDVKLGKIYQVLTIIDGQGKEEADVKELLEDYYNDNVDTALAAYTAAYSSYVDEVWDGTEWA